MFTQRPCTKLQEHVAAANLSNDMMTYVVTEDVVLAGQPQPTDWAKLAGLGFGLVINIRSSAERARQQAESARAAGLQYIHLSIPAYELERPHIEQFVQALAQQPPGKKVLFHCRTASRTGLVWLLKRVLVDGWPQAQAEAELQAAGYDADSMDVFAFCAEDYFERAGETAVTD